MYFLRAVCSKGYITDGYVYYCAERVFVAEIGCDQRALFSDFLYLPPLQVQM